MKTIFYSALLAATLTACGGNSSHSTTPVTSTNTHSEHPSNTNTTTSPYQGIWLNPDFGEVLAIDQHEFQFYQMAADQCLKTQQLPTSQLSQHFGELSRQEQQLTSHKTHDLEQRHYQLQQQLPFACEPQQLIIESDDPQLNFDWLWQSINDYYAGFTLRDIDWHQAKIDGQLALNDSEQWTVFANTINLLADPHAMLYSPTHGLVRSAQYTPLHQRIANESGVTLLQVEPLLQQRLSDAGQIIVANYLGQSAEFLTSEQVIYGELNHTTAYINLRSMNLNGDSNQANFEQAQQLVQALKTKLEHKTELIIDLRFNLGGNVLAAKTLADGLAIQSGLAYHIQYKSANGYSTAQAFDTQAGEQGFNGKISILTSPITGSAAEALIYYLKAGDPEVSLIGEATRGIQSGPSPRQLPNGWVVYVPNRKITSPDGQYLENSGFSPNFAIDNFTLEPLTQGKDLSLEWLLAQ